MSDTREMLEKIFNGQVAIKRSSPRPGESQYYYLDPTDTDGYSTISDFGVIDVPDDLAVPSRSSAFVRGKERDGWEWGVQNPNSSSVTYAHTNNNGVHIPPAQDQHTEEQTDLWQDIMRNGEYMANAGMQGLSFGWADEGEGLIHGSAYALMHHSPWSTHQDASGWDAFLRGYKSVRDQRRQNLQNGYEESPYLTGLAEVVGARVSPLYLIHKPARTAPLQKKLKNDRRRTVYSGLAYGIGSSENSDDYLKNIVSNVVGGAAGNEIIKGLFGVAGAPVGREILNPIISETVGTLTNKTIDKLSGGK